MTAGTNVTIRLSEQLDGRLDRLARDTRRSRATLAAEAVAAYVDHELATIDGIRCGLADVEAGRLVPHDEAMGELDAVIGGAGRP